MNSRLSSVSQLVSTQLGNSSLGKLGTEGAEGKEAGEVGEVFGELGIISSLGGLGKEGVRGGEILMGLALNIQGFFKAGLETGLVDSEFK